MAQVIADRRDIDFVLHEQLNVEAFSEYERFADFNKKTIDMIVSEARNLAIKEMMPVHREADEQGCTYENGMVKVPECYHRVYELFCEGEWAAMCDDPDWGGQGMPAPVALAAGNYFHGANTAFMLHNILVHGAGKLVETFGTDKQKQLYLKKMYAGEWGGSMLLTESDAGSDLGEMTTTAVKNDDGTYSLTGNKIFITSGETDLVPNIIHPVLARIEGAPKGPGGISLFLAPKFWVNDDGSLGERNDIVCTGIEEKMGIHGSPTCSMALGSKGACRGTLLGKQHKGLAAMFLMMNEARLYCGLQGMSLASASYLNTLDYARQRVQGRSLAAADKNPGPVPLIQHPDIRRMLLTMKSNAEAMRSLLFYIGWLEDKIKITHKAEDKAFYQGLIDVLIPVAKGHVTDKAFEMCSIGIQVLGGYGFTKEYPQEQHLRDCRITQIYEGTNGIQAMDLVGRKLTIHKGEAFKNLLAQIQNTIDDAGQIPALKELAQCLESNLNRLKELAVSLLKNARSENILAAYAQAHPFLDVTGDTVMAWMLLWRAVVASRKLEGKVKKKDQPFYEGQVKSAQFFIRSFLPVSSGKMDAILFCDDAAVDICESAFGA